MQTRAQILFPALIAGIIVLMVSNAIRSSFGVFQIPIADEFGWPRADFSFAIAIQNLAWGIGAPVFGAIAERFGDRKAIVLGAICYAAGLVLSAYAMTPGQHQLLEILVGFGIAGTGFGVVLAVVGRAASDDNRSLSLGIASAAGSLGQVFSAPVAEILLGVFPWQIVFMIFAASILSVIAVLPLMRAPERPDGPVVEVSMGAALRRAFRDPSFTLIFLGFFSCGYQLGFMVAHFPALVTEMCGPISPSGPLAAIGISSTSALGAAAISLIGLANIAGTLTAGWLGKVFPKKYVLAAIYTGRTLFAAMFILFPITPLTVVLFSIGMGSLWLATVPLTSGLVGHIYGLRYMGTLYGIVFLSHQVGSFMGVWLGGRLYDAYGDYTLVWWIGVAVGAFSAIVHLPVRERSLAAQAA
ncbi:MFS transporter [Defluviimonas sp. WL0050]|uniref:MFS transporter n=1 Tax=Albidovulum litorale TaxID=2984134 RepID=A0ABT2ZNS2_9RHOB|nr:MFS transporter [Defluviimonas sp. WL0050]MCV2872401.1 MFS transporter [Defluviimonas sp. WL0050]